MRRRGRLSHIGGILYRQGKSRNSGSIHLLAAPLFLALLTIAILGSRALAADDTNIAIVEADQRILEPANPFPLGYRQLRFIPLATGGYSVEVNPARRVEGRGERLALTANSSESLHISLKSPVQFFAHSYSDLFVHPQGAVSLGGPVPLEDRPLAASSGELLRDLVAGPPVIAALWNELHPARATEAGGVFVDEQPDRVTVSWVEVPSARPADQPNSFAVSIYLDGVIEIDYGAVATGWGVVGVSPGQDRTRVRMVDFTAGKLLDAREASLAWYRDLPLLNEVALARQLYTQTRDAFEFLSVFTNQPVDWTSLVGSTTVKNLDRGIGMPIFDQSSLFGSRNLEHVVVMNDLAFYDDDPSAPPHALAYAYAPSTLAILAHETGHRWLAHGSGAAARALLGSDGHWSFFLDSGASFMGGNALRANQDGSFTTVGAMAGFGPLDQYLMGIAPADAVQPFFYVAGASGFNPPRTEGGQAFAASSHPEVGVTFRGARRDLTVDDVIAAAGPRVPDAASGKRSFRMAFVLVVPAGTQPDDAQIEKIDRVRRAFSPFFREATSGRARMRTWIQQGPVLDPVPPDTMLTLGQPRILDATVERDRDGRAVVALDFADYEADLTTLEVSTDATQLVPPAQIDVTPGAYGVRRSSLRFALRDVPPAARAVRLSLIDRHGLRSDLVSRPLPPS